MSQSLQWAGVDTSTRTFAICVIDNDGQTIDDADLPADVAAVRNFLDCHAPDLAGVALETGTTSVHLARSLTGFGYPVSVYDASKVQRFLNLRPNKTDANDARGLAEIARVGSPHIRGVYQKSLDMWVLRSKLVIRERVIQMRKVNERALMSLFHGYGVRADEHVSSQTSLHRVVLKMIVSVERSYEVPIRELAMPLLALSASLRREELRLENDLKRYARKSDICRRFMEIPGVGVITAVSFLTAIGDPSRFSKSEDVGAYLGLTPQTWQTGQYVRKRGISKQGNALTRKHLHGAARQALNARKESDLQRWGKNLAARTNRRKAVIALARKLAVLMLTIWKNGSRFDFARASPQPKS